MPDVDDDLEYLPPMNPPVWIGDPPAELIVEGRSLTEAQVIGKAMDNLDRRRNGQIVGLPWPIEWPGLARALGPIEPGALIVIGSRPSVGKTMFGLQLLRSLAGRGLRVLYVTKELSATRLAWRHMASYGADLYHVRSGDVNQKDIDAITTYQQEAHAWKTSYDEKSQSVEDILAEVILRQPDIIIIDYLQRLAYNTEKEYAAITRLVNELQDMTLATDIPVVCLSQLSRPEKGKENRAPEMSDTRGSGAVEERAAVIVFLHRHWESATEERYGKEVKIATRATDEGWFIVRKNADGESGKFIAVTFKGSEMRIVERIAGLS